MNKEKIINFLQECSTNELLFIIGQINSYNDSLNHLEWSDIENFDRFCEGMTPWEIARACHFGEFNPCDDFFRWNVYGNFESTSYLSFDDDNIIEIYEALENIPFDYFPYEMQQFVEE